MIVKDEEDCLGECLRSVQGLADEIIIVDTGSSDRSPEIAESFGAMVVYHPWNNDFAEARNISLDHAGGDWILVLDADEILSSFDLPRIRELMENKEVAGYRLVQRTYQADNQLAEWRALDYTCPEARGCPGYVPSPLVRLFRRDEGITFRGQVHEVVEYAILEKGGRIVETDIPIHHYGKLRSKEKMEKKKSLYCAIGKEKLRDAPEDARAHRDMGIQYLELKKFVEAEAVLRKAAILSPNEAKIHFNLGCALEAQGRMEEAIFSYREALRCDSGHVGALNNLALLLEKAGQEGEIEALYVRAIESNPGQCALRYNFGFFLEKKGCFQEAMPQYEEALRIDQNFVDACFRMGIVAWKMGQRKEACGRFAEVLRKRPGHKEARLNLETLSGPSLSLCMIVRDEEEFIGRCIETSRRWVDEIVVVDTGSRDKTPEIARSFEAKVIFHPWTDDFSEVRNVSLSHASGDWIIVLDADEVIAERDWLKIRAYIREGQRPGYRLLQRNYDYDTSFAGRHRNTGDYEEGEGYPGFGISPLVRLFKRDERISFMGKVHEGVEPSFETQGLSAGDTDIPIHHYGKVRDQRYVRRKAELYRRLGEENLQACPPDVRALSDLGTQYLELGELARAEEVLKKAVELDPTRLRPHFDLGVLYTRQGQWLEALRAFLRAIELDPADASSRYNCGFVLEQLGQKDAALEQYREALAHNPDHVEANFRLGLMFLGDNEVDVAVRFLKRTISISPGHVAAHNNLGVAYERIGRYEESVREYKKALELDPEYENARHNLNRLVSALASISTPTLTLPRQGGGSCRDGQFSKGQLPSIIFFNKGISFNGHTLEERPLGGMETALINMARELAGLGCRVTVFCNCDRPGNYDGVEYISVLDFGRTGHAADIFISVRYPEPFLWDLPTDCKVLWTGDACDQPFIKAVGEQALWSRIDKVFTVSRWQAESFKSVFGIPGDKFYVTRNGINEAYFKEVSGVDRHVKRLVYTSTPFRGLDVLLEVFPEIRRRVSEAELYIYSSMAVYQYSKEDDERMFGEIYRRAGQPGVYLKGSVRQRDLAEALLSSSLLAYPNHFSETSCIAAIEAMAAGVPIVTTALGALPETVGDCGILIEGDAHSQIYKEKFVDAVCDLLINREKWARLSAKGRERALEFYSWKTIAGEWVEELSVCSHRPTQTNTDFSQRIW
ncbi:MAG: tetratricopeptide repeat protein [Thermodesulfobacteriota bacterium]